MKDEKKIYSIIRGKLDGFSASPPPHIWGNVQAQLAAQQRKTRRLYVGWISTAAIVVLAFLAGWYFNENSSIQENVNATNEIIQPKENATKTEIQSTKIASQNANEKSPDKSKELLHSETSLSVAALPVSSKMKSEKSEKIDNNKLSRETINISRIESADARVAQSQLPNSKLAIQQKTIPVNYFSESEKLLIAQNIENLKSASEKENNWKMGMYVAPGYSSYSANHSESYSKNMTYSGSEGNSNVSSGISIQYKTSKRWIVESGVYYAQNGQESGNSMRLFANNKDELSVAAPGENRYFSNAVRVENNNLTMNSTAGVIQFSDAPKGAEISNDFEAINKGVADLLVPNGQFSQIFQFMEIPLYVRYRIVDSKFGVELISGLNAGIVVGNDAYIDNQYGKQNIGETQDISPLNLSGTFGVGLNYALGKHFAVAVEPRFNYYLNSINTNSAVDFRPYRLGFFTGVSYEF